MGQLTDYELQQMQEVAAQKRRRQILVISIIALVAFAVGFVCGIAASKKFNPCVVVPTISIQRDTTYRTDTLRGEVPAPVVREIIRRDTLRLPSNIDTSYKKIDTSKRDSVRSPQAYVLPDGGISVPIEQRTYATPLYKATVSGWHPSLDSIEVYPTTRTITVKETKQAPRSNWVIATGPSVTYTADRRIVPGLSVLVGFNIKSL